jgi:hypothetical protein
VMKVKNSTSPKWRLIPKPLFSLVTMLWFMKSYVLLGKGRMIKILHQRAVFYLVLQRVLVIMTLFGIKVTGNYDRTSSRLLCKKLYHLVVCHSSHLRPT